MRRWPPSGSCETDTRTSGWYSPPFSAFFRMAYRLLESIDMMDLLI